MADDSNILLYPVERIVNPRTTHLKSVFVPRTLEEIKAKVCEQQLVKIDHVIDLLIEAINDVLVENKITLLTNDEDIKNGAFMLEAIRSALNGSFGLDHPYHKLANEIFDMTEGGLIVKAEKQEENIVEEVKDGA